jgi:hypothetical protein
VRLILTVGTLAGPQCHQFLVITPCVDFLANCRIVVRWFGSAG